MVYFDCSIFSCNKAWLTCDDSSSVNGLLGGDRSSLARFSGLGSFSSWHCEAERRIGVLATEKTRPNYTRVDIFKVLGLTGNMEIKCDQLSG